MVSSTHFFDVLHDIDPHLTHHFGIGWIKGLDMEETARRLGADLSHSATVRLAEAYRDADNDPAWGPYSSIYLLGEAEEGEGEWTICMQVQGWRLIEDDTLARLSRDGGQVFALTFYNDHMPTFHHSENGAPPQSEDMFEAERFFPEHTKGLRLISPVGADLENYDEMSALISEGFVLAGRVTGEPITDAWLRMYHERYIVAHDSP
ncbi:DUF6461 domain-containing protein [Nonomuraea sp. NPDC050310]|uniref:DUF6461 domain-containing protein n=1 Tax=Nonomuraea sp. NPDC050310 TaxID=3154935 RepID=UPI0033E68C30